MLAQLRTSNIRRAFDGREPVYRMAAEVSILPAGIFPNIRLTFPCALVLAVFTVLCYTQKRTKDLLFLHITHTENKRRRADSYARYVLPG